MIRQVLAQVSKQLPCRFHIGIVATVEEEDVQGVRYEVTGGRRFRVAGFELRQVRCSELAPVAQELESVSHVFGSHHTVESQQTPHLLAYRELLLVGQNDAGV